MSLQTRFPFANERDETADKKSKMKCFGTHLNSPPRILEHKCVRFPSDITIRFFWSENKCSEFCCLFATTSREEYQRFFQTGVFTFKHQYQRRGLSRSRKYPQSFMSLFIGYDYDMIMKNHFPGGGKGGRGKWRALNTPTGHIQEYFFIEVEKQCSKSVRRDFHGNLPHGGLSTTNTDKGEETMGRF